MSREQELTIDVEIPEDDLQKGALDVLKTLRPTWDPNEIKFLVVVTSAIVPIRLILRLSLILNCY